MKTLEEKRAYQRAYQAKKRANRTPEQREADRAYNRAWRAQRKEREDKVLERFQQSNDYEEVKELWERSEKQKNYAKNYYQANKERMLSQQKKRNEENPERVKANNKKFREENPDYHKNYYRKNREKFLARSKKAQPNYLENLDLTDETINNKTRLFAWGVQVRKRDENRCYYHSEECSKKIDAHHILPKEWKSKSSYHNFATMKFSLSNGQTLCRKHHMAVHKEMKKWMRE